VGAVRDQIVVRGGVILGPGVPRCRYAGIMALPAGGALDADERAVAGRWRFFGGDTVACPLAPRGSARTFTRLVSGAHTAMLVRHDPARTENNLYAGHTRFLRGLGLPVPRVLAEDAARSIALFSDAGERSVQDMGAGWREAHLEPLYRRVLTRMVVFHEEGARAARRVKLPLMPPFDRALYAWEHDLLVTRFLRERVGVDAATERAVRAELEAVAGRLLALPRVLLHRDFQSSNVLVEGGCWTLIDYQGMRLGPAVYDLASLLCDPYIALAPAVRDRLLAHYARRANRGARVEALFWPAAVQRLGQALGAYARLAALPGTGHFARHIPVAVARLGEAAERTGGLPVLGSVLNEVVRAMPTGACS
jgi:aminoglycoside/choline kinase family phosphotransferase